MMWLAVLLLWPATALAAATVYLMVPPLDSLTMPVGRSWRNVRAYDSAAACERGKDALRRQASQWLTEYQASDRREHDIRGRFDCEFFDVCKEMKEADRQDRQFNARLLATRAALDVSQCIGSDDPRLR